MKKILRSYTTKTIGHGFNKRIFLEKDNKPLSFWHDINF